MEAIETSENGRVAPENSIDEINTTATDISQSLPTTMSTENHTTTCSSSSVALPLDSECDVIENGKVDNHTITEPTPIEIAISSSPPTNIGSDDEQSAAPTECVVVAAEEPSIADGVELEDGIVQEVGEEQRLYVGDVFDSAQSRNEAPSLFDEDLTSDIKTEEASSAIVTTEEAKDAVMTTMGVASLDIPVAKMPETVLPSVAVGDSDPFSSKSATAEDEGDASVEKEETKTVRGETWMTFDDDTDSTAKKPETQHDSWLSVVPSTNSDANSQAFSAPAMATKPEDEDETGSSDGDKGNRDGGWMELKDTIQTEEETNKPMATGTSFDPFDNSVLVESTASAQLKDETTSQESQAMMMTDHEVNRRSFEESLERISQDYEKLDSTPSSQRQSIGDMGVVAKEWTTFDEDDPGQLDTGNVSSAAPNSAVVSPVTVEQGSTAGQITVTEGSVLASETTPGQLSQSQSGGISNTSLSSAAGGFTASPLDWQPAVAAGNQSASFEAQFHSASALETAAGSVQVSSSTEQTSFQPSDTDVQRVPLSAPVMTQNQQASSTTFKQWVSFDDDGVRSPTRPSSQSQPQQQQSVFFGNSFQQPTAVQGVGAAGNPFTKELLASQQQPSVDQFHPPIASPDNVVLPSSSYNPFQGGAVGGAVHPTQPTSPSFHLFDGGSSVQQQQPALAQPMSPGNPFRIETVATVNQQPASPFATDVLAQQSTVRAPWPLASPTVAQPQTFSPAVLPVKPAEFAAALPVADDIPVMEEIPSLDDDVDGGIGERFEDEYPPEPYDPLRGWALQLRVPSKKTLTGSRTWKPVRLRLIDGNVLQLYNESNPMEPFRELPLQSSYMFSMQKRQPYNTQGKIHTVKVEYVSYKEKKKFGAKNIEHISTHAQLLKVGSTDYKEFRSFIRAVNDTLMRLPAHRDRGATYRQDSITIDVTDECRARLTKNGETDKLSTTVHIHCLSFVTGMPECALGLNDYHRKGVEVVSRQDIIPHKSDQWIKMENVELHNCVDKEKFVADRFIEFNPLDACTFEVMRFQVRPDKSQDLPLTVKVVVSGEHAHIELRADVLIPGHRSKKSMQANPTENIMICFPIPESWIPMFRVETKFGYSSVRSTTKKAGKIKKGSLSPGLIEVSVGTAKYEHPYRSLVWRIPRLPEKNTDPHTTQIFMCRMDLSSDRDIPSIYNKYALVEYTMPYTTASRTAIRSIAVANQRSPDKLVRYRAHYGYEVEIEQNFHFTATLEDEDPRQCIQQ